MTPPTADTFWLPVLLPVLLVLVVYRLTRLITTDDFPPVLWVRDRLALTEELLGPLPLPPFSGIPRVHYY